MRHVELQQTVVITSVERVVRTYRVSVPVQDDTEEMKVDAEERVRTGEVHKFTEGDAEIEEIIGVEIEEV